MTNSPERRALGHALLLHGRAEVEQPDRRLGRAPGRGSRGRAGPRAARPCASSRRDRARARRAARGRRRRRSRADPRGPVPASPLCWAVTATSVGARCSLTAEPGCSDSASSISRSRVRSPRTRKRQGLVRWWLGAQRASSNSSSSTAGSSASRGERLVRAARADSLLDVHARNGRAKRSLHGLTRDEPRRNRGDRLRRAGGGRDQHARRQRHADHLPGAAGVRLRAGDGERVEHDRPGAGQRLGRGRLSTRAGRPARPRRCASARCRCRAASPARCCCWCCRPSAFKAIVPVFIAIALVLTLLQPRLARGCWQARDRPRAQGRACSCRSRST